MSQSGSDKKPSFPSICLTIGINFKSHIRLPDEHCFSYCTFSDRALTVQMKPTHSLVLHFTWECNALGFVSNLSQLCLRTMGDFSVVAGADLNFLLTV